MSTPEEPQAPDEELAGYGAAETGVTEDTPPQVQPLRPDHEPAEPGDAPPDERREEREAAEHGSGRGAV